MSTSLIVTPYHNLMDRQCTLSKRYWLFAGDSYYPGGGFSDFVDSYDTMEEATVEAKSLRMEFGPSYTPKKYDWYHIFDSVEKIAYEENYEPNTS